MKKFGRYSCLVFGVILAAASQASAAEKYIVGVSNTLVGNGWREEMVCSIKAEALASGMVSKVILANRNGGPSEQIADLRNLISAGVNIIIINPSDRKALDPVIKQAADRHIVVVAVDQAVSAPSAYILTNDHVVAGADRVTVTLLDGRQFVGKVHRDPKSDLALIKIDADSLPAAQLADSEGVKIGQWALAFGSPFALNDTMTVGVVSSLNSKVDSSSRMLQVRANIPNPDGSLLPGMYLSVSVASGAPRSLVTIPSSAVAFNPYGSLVYVLHDETDAKGKVRYVVKQQFVTTGASRGDQVSILKGVGANDVVVTAGQLKLHNGSVVKIDNAVQPTDNPTPVPQDH